MIRQPAAAVVLGMALALGGTGSAANAPTKKPNTASSNRQSTPERLTTRRELKTPYPNNEP